MNAQHIRTYTLGLILLTLFYAGNAAQCSYELPPNEQVTLTGNDTALRTLRCEVEPKAQAGDFLLDFFSETNTSVVNNLIMPEGTLMSLSFASMHDNELRFELKPKAKLGITNDSPDFIRLKCHKS